VLRISYLITELLSLGHKLELFMITMAFSCVINLSSNYQGFGYDYWEESWCVGGGKVWRIGHLKVLVRKSLANINESLDGAHYLTGFAHMVSLVFSFKIIVSHFYPRGVCVDPPSHQFVVSRNFQRLDIDKLNEILTCDDIWDDVFSKFDYPSDCLECFNLIMSYLLDLLIPPRTLRTRRQNCPWLSSCVLAIARRLHDVAHRKALKSGSDLDWSNYRALHNKATSMLQSAKTAYFNGLISTFSTKPGKFWRHFHCLSRRSKSANNDVQLLVTANDFNNHFLAIPVANVSSSVPATEFLDKHFGDWIVPTLQFSHVDYEIVSSIVSSLDLLVLMDSQPDLLGFLRTW